MHRQCLQCVYIIAKLCVCVRVLFAFVCMCAECVYKKKISRHYSYGRCLHRMRHTPNLTFDASVEGTDADIRKSVFQIAQLPKPMYFSIGFIQRNISFVRLLSYLCPMSRSIFTHFDCRLQRWHFVLALCVCRKKNTRAYNFDNRCKLTAE